jgi:hypothetical protein
MASLGAIDLAGYPPAAPGSQVDPAQMDGEPANVERRLDIQFGSAPAGAVAQAGQSRWSDALRHDPRRRQELARSFSASKPVAKGARTASNRRGA